MFEPASGAACDPAFTALFVPARSRLGTYEVCTTGDLPAMALSTGGFVAAEAERLEVLDAFGAGGSFDRSRLTQLFNGRRLEVRRGWRIADGRFESMTAISPYPDTTLSVLREGTLTIRWTAALRR
ncbi:MAG TPA: hypothetical protein VH497_14370 [Vicinamibacterales bacterium]|jgi:hypothetical protein